MDSERGANGSWPPSSQWPRRAGSPDGDVVEVEIDGLGALANPVRSE
jgi:hypothetical protein